MVIIAITFCFIAISIVKASGTLGWITEKTQSRSIEGLLFGRSPAKIDTAICYIQPKPVACNDSRTIWSWNE